MSDSGRVAQNAHPAIDLLLRYVEDDLRAKERRVVAHHLSGCWTCKVQIEEIQAGISGLMKFREEVLLPATPIDPRATAVRDRVLRRAHEDSPPSRPVLSIASVPLGNQPAFFRPAWIAGSVSLIVFCMFFFSTAVQPRLMAGEFLEHVESSLATNRAKERGRVVRQRVRIRRGASYVDRDVVRGRAGTQETPVTVEPAWIGASGAMSGPIAWDDPLAPDTFVRWRLLQTVRREEVTMNPDSLILTVAVGENMPGVIRKASLVVRRSDWHIVAKRVESWTEPALEATETGYDVRDEAAVVRSPASAPAMKGLHSSSPGYAAAGAESGADIDETEIQVRSVLFHLGVGLGAEEVAPSVHRVGNVIEVQGVVSSAERRAQLAHALESIPNTIDRIVETVTLPPGVRMISIPAVPPTVRSRPPQLRPFLIDRLGNEKNATDFSNDVLTGSGKIFDLAVQYRELAQRYPRAEAAALPAHCRPQLDALVLEVEHELQLHLQNEATKLHAIQGEPSGPEPEAAGAPWQDRAERLFQLALAHDRLVSLLFAVTVSETPKPEDAASNLDQLGQVRQAMTSILSPRDSAVR